MRETAFIFPPPSPKEKSNKQDLKSNFSKIDGIIWRLGGINKYFPSSQYYRSDLIIFQGVSKFSY